MRTPASRLRLLAGTAACLPLTSALAHHPMDGQVPDSALDGLLSGLGHPVIEPVHLLFLLGAAALAGVTRVPTRTAILLLVLYVLASLGATALEVAPVGSAGLKLALAGSLLALAPWLWLRRFPAAVGAAALAAVAGAAHGLAFAEAVVGAESTPILAYLAGLALVQSGLLAVVCIVLRRIVRRHPQGLANESKALAGSLLAAGLVLALAGA